MRLNLLLYVVGLPLFAACTTWAGVEAATGSSEAGFGLGLGVGSIVLAIALVPVLVAQFFGKLNWKEMDW